MNVYLGFGHPLPIWLAVIGVLDLLALPFLLVTYVREALGPHEAPVEEARCEFCDTPGCHWSNHAEARADVAAWQREEHALLFPFGDHHES